MFLLLSVTILKTPSAGLLIPVLEPPPPRLPHCQDWEWRDRERKRKSPTPALPKGEGAVEDRKFVSIFICFKDIIIDFVGGVALIFIIFGI